jgi:glycosyl transferase family 25
LTSNARPGGLSNGGFIPIVVINLRRAADRRERITGQLQALGLRYTLFEAVDGSAMPAQLRERMDPRPIRTEYGRELTAGEIGCGASYLQVLESVASGQDEFVCVLEDDATLAPDALQLLDPAWLRTLPRFDILRLLGNNFRPLEVPVAQRGRYAVTVPLRSDYCTTAQIFSRAGAASAAAAITPMRLPIDVLFYRDPGLRLRLLEVRPAAAAPNGSHSTIGTAQYRRDPRRKRRPLLVMDRAMLLAYRKLNAVLAFRSAWGLRMLFRLRRPPSPS